MAEIKIKFNNKKKAATKTAAGGGGGGRVAVAPARKKESWESAFVKYGWDKKTNPRTGRPYTLDEYKKERAPVQAERDRLYREKYGPALAAEGAGAGAAEAAAESDDETGFEASIVTDDKKVDPRKTDPTQEEERPGKPGLDDGQHEDETLGDLDTDKDPTKIPPIVPPINQKGDELPGQTFNPAEIPGMSWVPGAIGAGLGLLSGLRPEPTFNRMETMNKWDDYGREKFAGIWKDSETNPVEGDYYRNAQRTAITSTNAMIENDAQKQAMQAASAGGTVFAGGNQRAMAQMAPALYGQMAQNLSRGYQIRDDAAKFREGMMYNNTNEQYKQWSDDYDYGRLGEQNRGAWLVDKAAKNTVAGLGQGLNLASQLHDMDITNRILEKSLGSYSINPTDPTAMLQKSVEESGKGLLDIESMPDLPIDGQGPRQGPFGDPILGDDQPLHGTEPFALSNQWRGGPLGGRTVNPEPTPEGTPAMRRVDELVGLKGINELPADTPGIGWMKSTDLVRPDQPINMPQPMPPVPLTRPVGQPPAPAPAPGTPVPIQTGPVQSGPTPTAAMNVDTTRGPVVRTDYAGLLDTQRLQDEMKKKQKKSLGLNLAAGLVQAGASFLPGVGPLAGSLAGGLLKRMA